LITEDGREPPITEDGWDPSITEDGRDPSITEDGRELSSDGLEDRGCEEFMGVKHLF
jgi:hypothetical protein